ncbi:restriction endonuclease subunit S [Sphingobacterium thalpophilum]|uniref:restriction endonuclease subunit S n=1 Tax=Sphingobacterium thalpophilum TaxID=259 RepID=UPI00068B4967|nr:restriction endonuclease subunit S [Sphingobacterium thalpophilum]
MTEIKKENKSVGKVPNLRFPQFTEEWETKKLGDVMDFKVTNSFSRENLNYKAGTVKNIHYGDIHTKFQTLFDTTKEVIPFINEEINLDRISNENYCKEGDVIFADASEDLNDVGKSIEIVNVNGEKLLSGLHTLLARPKKSIFHLGFNGYLFKSNSVRTQIQKESQGSKVLSINVGRISKIDLSFPAVDEQQKITSFFALLDERIQTQNKIIGEINGLKATVIKKIFAGQLKFKDDNGKDFPNWNKTALAEIGEFSGGGTPSSSNIDFWNGNIPWVSSSDLSENNIRSINVSKFITESAIDNSATKLCPAPMILIVSRVGVGKVAYSDRSICTSQDFLNVYNFNCNGLFLTYLISKEMKKAASNTQGTSIKGITASEIKSTEIQLPCKPEQNKIADFLSSIDLKIDIENQFLQKLEEQKKFLLQQMFV